MGYNNIIWKVINIEYMYDLRQKQFYNNLYKNTMLFLFFTLFDG